MIEFRGEIDGRCKKYRLYVESMVGLVCTLIPALLIAFAITICLIVIDWVFALAYIPLVLFVVFAAIAPLSKKHKNLRSRIVCKFTMIVSKARTKNFMISDRSYTLKRL